MRRSSIFKENHVFIEECENLKILVVDGGELTRNNNKRKISEVLQAYRC